MKALITGESAHYDNVSRRLLVQASLMLSRHQGFREVNRGDALYPRGSSAMPAQRADMVMFPGSVVRNCARCTLGQRVTVMKPFEL